MVQSSKGPAEAMVGMIRSMTAKWTKQRKSEERHASAQRHRLDRLVRAHTVTGIISRGMSRLHSLLLIVGRTTAEQKVRAFLLHMQPALNIRAPVWTHEPTAGPQSITQALEALAQRAQYQRDEEIYSLERSVECWYRVVSGAARRFALRADGRRQTVDLL
jgi:CRP-like cAMP-binding protein